MKLKATRLFGVDQNRKTCYFIHEEGLGFWFLSHKERTVGEAKMLKLIATEIEQVEIQSNWLLLEISKGNKEELLLQIKDTNFTIDGSDIDSLAKNDVDRLVEIYVRTLIGDLDFVNPVLWKYKDRLEANISKNRELFFEYQMKVVETLFECRVITDDTCIQPDDRDIEKGYIEQRILSDPARSIIGLKEPFNYDELSEPLALKIYQYANKDFAGVEHETTAMLEVNEKKAKVDLIETDEKKTPLVLEPLTTSEK